MRLTSNQKLPIVAALAAFFAAAGLAQGPPGGFDGPGGIGGPPDPDSMARMRVEQLSSNLKLTAAQKTAAGALYAKSSTATQELQQSIRANRDAMQTAIRNNDQAAIEKLATDIGAATAQMTTIEAKADAEFYQTLTAEQKKKYESMPRMGPGGRGFGPPPQGGRGGGQ